MVNVRVLAELMDLSRSWKYTAIIVRGTVNTDKVWRESILCGWTIHIEISARVFEKDWLYSSSPLPLFGHIWDVMLVWRNTIRYDTVYLTCSKKLTGSQLSPPHGTNQKLKCKTKNKTMSMIGPVQSHCHEGSPVGKRSLRWEGFVKKVGFEPGVKEWRSGGWWEWWW